VVVGSSGQSGWARRIPIIERFVVWLDDEGILRTDHSMYLWHIPVVRLHYRLERQRELDDQSARA